MMYEVDKYEPEFVSVEDLCCIVKRLDLEINQLSKHIDLFGESDDEFNSWMISLSELCNRRDWLNRRIRSRKAKITEYRNSPDSGWQSAHYGISGN